MIPNHRLADPPNCATINAPRNVEKLPLIDYSLGPDDIEDTTNGIASKTWTGIYSGGQVILSASGVTPVSVLTVANVANFSFCFNRDGRVAIAYALRDGSSALYFYSEDLVGYTTLDLGGGLTPRVCIDQVERTALPDADVLCTYMLGGSLYAREETDEFATPYLLKSGLAGKLIGQFGINALRAVQWQILPAGDVAVAEFPPAAPLFQVIDTKQFAPSTEGLCPFVWVAAAADYADFPGAVIELSRDGGMTWTVVGAISADAAAVIGTNTAPLADHSNTYPDVTNTLTLQLDSYGASLASTTGTLLPYDANLSILGGELLQFRDAAPLGGGAYDCTYLLRGRHQSEAVAHSAGERFVVMDSSKLLAIPLEAYDIGEVLHFRATAIGGEDSTEVVLTFEANCAGGS